jgi:DNA-binding winged helix-turn-helix (wHTH) protein
MSHPDNNFYGFGDFRLDAAERALYHAENLVPLTPKAIETLLVLVRHAGHIVGKEELIQAVWPDTFVEEGNLNVNIFALRKALGERTGEQSFIETVPRRGYRFVVPVQLAERNGEALIIERRTRARIVTEVEDDSDAAPSSAAALEVPWQGEDRGRFADGEDGPIPTLAPAGLRFCRECRAVCRRALVFEFPPRRACTRELGRQEIDRVGRKESSDLGV